MHPAELDKLYNYLEEVTNATNEGRMPWSQANPTTYVYTSAAPAGKVVIQKVQGTIVLEAVSASNTPRLQIAGTDNARVGQLLRNLFETIERVRDIKGLSFLKSLLPPPEK